MQVTVNGVNEIEALLNVMPTEMFKNSKKVFTDNALKVQKKITHWLRV